MAERKQTKTSDEIELGQFFELIRRTFTSIFNTFLRFFLYIKRNIYILIGLGVLGIAAGYGLKQISSEELKTEVIVHPNIDSKEYLYDVVSEIQANIRAGKVSFFDSLGIDIKNLKGSRISVESMGNKNSKLENELKYLELFRGLEISGTLTDIVRNEILSRNSLNHKIVFYYSEETQGQQILLKLMDYIDSNPYYSELILTYQENAKSRIEQNSILIKQLDRLIEQHTENIGPNSGQDLEGKIVLDSEEKMNMADLFRLKSSLINDIEAKKIELKKGDSAIKVINIGKPQKVKTPFFGKTLVLLPLIFVGAFFLFSIFKLLNKKAEQLI